MRAFLVVLGGVLCVALFLATPSGAENEAPPTGEQGRYAMTPAEGGFLRLDTATGSVSFCSAKDGQSMCRAGADEIAALKGEVDRLRQENAELKSKLSGAPAAQSKDSSGLPSEEEFDSHALLRRKVCAADHGDPSRGGAEQQALSLT
ncbi:MAG: hypothetical protein ACRD36_11080, partial [Candidatus Acidiferrum sp.]